MSMAEIGAFIEKSAFGKILSRSEQVQFASWLTEVKLLPEDFLFRQGDHGNGLYLVVSGKIEVFMEPREDVQLIITILSSGDTIGEFTLLEPATRSASAIARTASTLYFLSVDRFEQWKEGYHPVAFKLLRFLCKMACSRLRQMNEQIALQFIDIEDVLSGCEDDGAPLDRPVTLTNDEERFLIAARTLFE